jgi:hypothetical protein
MSKISQEAQEEQEQELSLEEELGIDGENDYGFVIGADGELKHLFTPDQFYLDPPPVVRKILKLLGIKDINLVATDSAPSDSLH